MKTLLQFITEAQSKVTVEWMKEHYAKYNKELFDGDLPDTIELGLINDVKETALGWQGFNKTFYCFKDSMKNGMYIMYYHPGSVQYFNAPFRIIQRDCLVAKSAEELKPYIKMSVRYNMSDFQKEDTLIHEMIHLWVSKDGLEPKRAHGKEFKSKCDEIRAKAKKLYGIEYQLTTYAKNSSDPEKSYDVSDEAKNVVLNELRKAAKRGGGIYSIYIIYNSGVQNPHRFFFCTKNKLSHILNQIQNNRLGSNVEHIFISNASYEKMCIKHAGRFPTANNLGTYYIPSKDGTDMDIMLKDAEDILEINESFASKIKSALKKIMSIFARITKKTPSSEIDMEDLLNDIEKQNNESDEEIKGDKKIESQAIEFEK